MSRWKNLGIVLVATMMLSGVVTPAASADESAKELDAGATVDAVLMDNPDLERNAGQTSIIDLADDDLSATVVIGVAVPKVSSAVPGDDDRVREQVPRVGESLSSTGLEGSPLAPVAEPERGSEVSGAAAGGNPWGCLADSHRPHESTRSPGSGWIQAKSDTTCTFSPPPGAQWKIVQSLYRSSWRGWAEVTTKTSTCPAGQGNPDCRPKFMRAFINWNCSVGTHFNYRVVATHYLTVSGTTYSASSSDQSGNWWEDGTVYCSR